MKQNHDREFRRNLFVVIGYQVLTVALISLSLVLVKIFTVATALPSHNIFFNTTVVFQRILLTLIMTVLVTAKSRLTLVNDSFEKKGNSLERLRKLLLIHSKFGDVIKLINKSVSMNIMFCISEFLFNCTFISFQLYNTIILNTLKNQIFLLSGLLILVSEIIYMSTLFITSMLLKCEAKKTLSVSQTNNFLLRSTPGVKSDLLKYLHLSSLQIGHQEIAISCGLFTIDFKFLFLLLAGYLSNLVILIQFDIKQ